MASTAIAILNASLQQYFEKRVTSHRLILGESVDTGSYISGLSEFLKSTKLNNARVINLPNIESTTGGICFGWNISSGPAFLFIKQLDFITLYLDDLIHTRNMFDRLETAYNINIFTFVVDTWLEGAQSSLRNLRALNEFLEITIVKVTFVSEPANLESLIEQPGIKLFVVSQKHAKTPLPEGKQVKLVSRHMGDVFEGFEVYSQDFREHPLPMVLR